MALPRAKGSISALLTKRRAPNFSPDSAVKELDPIKGERLDHVQRIERACSGTIKSAGIYYDTNRKINLIIVSVEVVLLANSLGYTWYKQSADAWSIFSGGIGITSFVTLFFTKPQQNITKALGNLAQIQMIYRSYCLQFDTILDAHVRNEVTAINGSSDSIDELDKLNSALQSATHNAVTLIQEKVETEEINRTDLRIQQTPTGIDKASTTQKITTTLRDLIESK